MTRLARPVRLVALLSSVGLLVALALVGAVAVVAQTQGSWSWLLVMEKTVAASTPVVLALSGLALVALFGAAVVADR